MKSPGKHPRLVCQIINDVLEKTNKARTDTGKLFHKLVKEEVVEKEKFVAGYVCTVRVVLYCFFCPCVTESIDTYTHTLVLLDACPATFASSPGRLLPVYPGSIRTARA